MKSFEHYTKLNESNDEPEFKVGDVVKVNDRLLYDIRNYGWNESMRYYVGLIFTITKVEYSVVKKCYRYYIPTGSFIYGNCLSLFNEPEESKQKIRWYKKGKLLREKLENGQDYVGKKVKIRDDSNYRHEAYADGRDEDGDRNGCDGDGYGIITHYIDFSDNGNETDHVFRVRWNNECAEHYRLKDLDIVDEEPIAPPRIRWYKKGRLQENKLNEDVRIEKIVDIGNILLHCGETSIYKRQTILKNIFNDKMCEFRTRNRFMRRAFINDVNIMLNYETTEEFVYFNINTDLVSIDETYPVSILSSEKDPSPRVRWYKHGKLE